MVPILQSEEYKWRWRLLVFAREPCRTHRDPQRRGIN